MNFLAKTFSCFASFLSVTLLLCGSASAQLIDWQDSVPMYDVTLEDPNVQTFVDTTGNLAVGYNATNDMSLDGAGQPNTSVTVNGVPFIGAVTGDTLGGAGTETITLFGTNLTAVNGNAFGDGNFTSDGQIFHLIRGASFEVETVTLGGLEMGQEYLIQVFTHDARNSRNSNTIVGFGDGSGATDPSGTSQVSNSVPGTIFNVDDPAFDQAIADAQILVGNSVIGTFTAGAASLTFNVFGSNNAGDTFATAVGPAQINAIQLRRVEEVTFLVGDFNGDMVVDCADLDGYVGNIGAAAAGALAALDIDGDGVLSFADADDHIATLIVTSNGVTGTFRGDVNCDGQVSVLGDAFALVANLNNSVTSYAQGDLNFDGTVSVLGDAFILVGSLGMSNQ